MIFGEDFADLVAKPAVVGDYNRVSQLGKLDSVDYIRGIELIFERRLYKTFNIRPRTSQIKVDTEQLKGQSRFTHPEPIWLCGVEKRRSALLHMIYAVLTVELGLTRKYRENPTVVRDGEISVVPCPVEQRSPADKGTDVVESQGKHILSQNKQLLPKPVFTQASAFAIHGLGFIALTI